MGAKKDKKRKKRTALVVCHDGKEFWTTQAEFWQWVREQTVVKVSDNPLKGCFRNEDEERLVLLNHTVLNLGAPNHLRESMLTRRLSRKR